MKLIDNYQLRPDKFNIEKGEKVFEIVGMSQKNVQEFSSPNISDFNKVVEDAKGVDYYSIGAQKQRLMCSDLLRVTHEDIQETLVNIRSDGLVRPEEAHWGRYLLTFEQDHLEIAGLNSAEYMPMNVFNLITDNIRVNEIKDSPEEAQDYGLEHLVAKQQQA